MKKIYKKVCTLKIILYFCNTETNQKKYKAMNTQDFKENLYNEVLTKIEEPLNLLIDFLRPIANEDLSTIESDMYTDAIVLRSTINKYLKNKK